MLKNTIKENLIYDIGMHNGEDTCHYFKKSYTVIAVKADPILGLSHDLKY